MERLLGFTLSLTCILTLSTANAVTITALNNGDWNLAATWDVGVPTAADDVIISGRTVDITSAAACNSVTLNASATAHTRLNVTNDTLAVVGNFVINQNAGNTDILFYIENSAVVNVGGDLSTTTTAGDDIFLYLNTVSGTDAELNISGNMNVSKLVNGGDDFFLRLDDANSTLSVLGNMTVNYQGNADALTFDLNGGVLSIAQATSITSATSAGTVYFDMDGGNFSTNDFTATYNGNYDFLIYIDGASQFSVGNNFSFTHQSGDDVFIRLNNANGTTAQMNVAGDFTFNKPTAAGDDLIIQVNQQNSILTIGGNLTIDYDGTWDDITLDLNNGTTSIAGQTTLTGTNGVGSFYFDLDGGDFTTGPLTTSYTGNGDYLLYVDDTSAFTVNGTMTTTFFDGDDHEIRLNNATGTNASMNVTGNYAYTKSTAGGDNIYILVDDASSALTIGGDMTVIYDGNGDAITVDGDNGTFQVTGNTSFTGTNGVGNFTFDLDNMDFSTNNLDFDYDGIGDINLFLDGTSQITVSDSMNVDFANGDDVDIRLNWWSGTTSQLNITNGFRFTKPAVGGDNFFLGIDDVGSVVSVGGDFNTTWNGANDAMTLNLDGGTFAVAGNTTISMNAGTGNSNWDMDGCDFTTTDYTFNYGGVGDMFWYLDNSSDMTVHGNFSATLNSGDDMFLYLNANGGTNSQLTITGNMTINQPAAGDDINVLVDDANSLISIGGNYSATYNGNTARHILNLDNGSFTVAGDIDIIGGASVEDLIIDLDGCDLTAQNMDMNFGGTDDFFFDVDADSRVNLNRWSIDMTAGDDFYFRLNANNGQTAKMNVTNDLTITHAGADDSYLYLRQSSKLSVGGNLTIDHTTSGGDYFEIDMSNNNDSLIVGGNMIFAQAGTSNNAADDIFFDVNGGLVNIAGHLTMTKNTGDDMELEIANNGNVTVQGNLNMIQNGGDDSWLQLNSNGSCLKVLGDLNLTQAGGDNMEFEGNSICTMIVRGDINLSATAEQNMYIDMNGTATLQLGGSIVRPVSPSRFGNLDMAPNTTIIMNGTVTQTIAEDYGDGNDRFIYQNLVINNSGGVRPQLSTEGEVTVYTDITFIDGVVSAPAAGPLVVADNATATTANDTSHITGTVVKTGNNAFTFPLGSGVNYRPISITAPNGNADEFEASYFATDPDLSYDDNAKGITLEHISNCEYWTLDQTNGTDIITPTLSWGTGSCGVDDINDLRVVRWDGAAWRDEGANAVTGNNASGTLTSVASMGTFGPFTLGSSTSFNPLPVELVFFNAELRDDVVALTWETATELNNDYFTVERTLDGVTFEPILNQDGAGNSNQSIHYEGLDQQPKQGVNYYRLKQTDFDGGYEYSSLVPIRYSPKELGVKVFPNPSDGNNLYLKLTGSDGAGTAEIELFDLRGKFVHKQTLRFEGSAIAHIKPDSDRLAPGTYILNVAVRGEAWSNKLIIR